MKKRTRKLWTKEETAELIRLHPNMSNKDIAKKMGRAVVSIYGMTGRLKLHKSDEYLRKKQKQCGLTVQKYGTKTQFKKGHKTWNTGMKGLRFPGSEKGQFKKGNLPHNTLHDGAIVIRHMNTGHQGGKKPYKYIRLSKANWKLLHVLLWEKKYGTVPSGMRLWFKDNNSLNCDIDNLELITASEAMRRIHQRDEYIAMRIAQKGQKGKGVYDKSLREEIMRHPELLEAKRRQFHLNKMIKEKQCKTTKNL